MLIFLHICFPDPDRMFIQTNGKSFVLDLPHLHARVWVKSEEIGRPGQIDGARSRVGEVGGDRATTADLNLAAMEIVVSIDAKLSLCVFFFLF
jgi:hypothetical protein